MLFRAFDTTPFKLHQSIPDNDLYDPDSIELVMTLLEVNSEVDNIIIRPSVARVKIIDDEGK